MQQTRSVCPYGIAILAALVSLVWIAVQPQTVLAAGSTDASLRIIRAGKPAEYCPLRHTDVKVAVSGSMVRSVVTQEFSNASQATIEAIYTFPLPQNAAVDDMTIQVGERTIRGIVKRREEAEKMYEQAIRRGQTAALLDQERPNIFTQRVGNIPAGTDVRVTITYVASLQYKDGGYEFVFPMVVGPRYVPGNVIGKKGQGSSADSDKVPDGSKITPPVTAPGTRAGHDISIAVNIDAGVPINDVRSSTHDVVVRKTGANGALVTLRKASVIPNKDFILRYDVAGTSIAEGVLTHTSEKRAPANTQSNGYFALIIQPPERIEESDVTPKEIVFVLDSSGSMSGFPIEKSKRFMEFAIDRLYPGDTFNVIKFSGSTAVLSESPVYPTAENVTRAREFVKSDWGGGGTEMMKAIRAALVPSDSSGHVRIVVFLTDGYVGDDMAIISEIQKHPNARIFAYGIGSSVNRFLLDKMAEAGRGVVEYVSSKQQDEEAEAAANRLYERLRAPLLTDISLDFGSLPVTDAYPRNVPDLFSASPVVVTGRYTGAASGTVRLTAQRAGMTYTKEIPVVLPAHNTANAVLPNIWAREKIDDLMAQDWKGLQEGRMRDDLRQQITRLGLDYNLMTQFTSFVAVEERVVTDGGKPKRIQVPVELPEDVRHNADGKFFDRLNPYSKLSTPASISSGGVIGSGSGVGAGIGGGAGGGYGGGVFRVGGGVTPPTPISTPAPQSSDEARAAKISGTVVLSAVVQADGSVGDVRVIRAIGLGLDQNAVEAAKLWKFRPAMRDGKPVAAQVRIEFAFASGAVATDIKDEGEATAPTVPPRNVDAKLHPKLVAAYDCSTKGMAAEKKCAAVEPYAIVDVIVVGDATAALEELKKVGLEPLESKARPNHVLGRIKIRSLGAIADLAVVKFVAPGASHASGQ